MLASRSEDGLQPLRLTCLAVQGSVDDYIDVDDEFSGIALRVDASERTLVLLFHSRPRGVALVICFEHPHRFARPVVSAVEANPALQLAIPPDLNLAEPVFDGATVPVLRRAEADFVDI